MLRNYFKVAFRTIKGNKVFSFINIFGLAIGISAALVIYLIVQYEFSFNRFGKDDANTYRVISIMHFPNQEFKNSGVPGPLAKLAPEELPGIVAAAAFWDAYEMKVNIPNGTPKETEFKNQVGIAYADKNYFTLFPYTWVAGSAQVSLAAPHQVVLTESRAKQYFAITDATQAMGRTITYEDTIHATVTGIVKDLKKPTDFLFGDFISYATFEALDMVQQNNLNHWGSINSASQFFVKLQSGTDVNGFNKKFAQLRQKHAKEGDGLACDYYLQPLNDLHFNNDYDAFSQRQAHKPTLYGLLAVAAFLLLLGCINFINLTTAQAIQRAKEIGIRKTMGSSKRQLIFQFLSETFLLTLMATGLSLILTPWILHIFSDYIPEGLTFSATENVQLWLFAGILLVGVSFFSGFYPALVLSRYQPVQVLKGQAVTVTGSATRKTLLRKTLTVTQFVIAQFFIIATLMVGKQIRFSLNKDLGFNKEAIVNFNVPVNYDKPDYKQYVLMEKLRILSGISKISLGGGAPASGSINMSTFKINVNGKDIETTVTIKQADSAYLGLYNMKLKAGRNLQNSDTSREYLINEAYARFLGCKKPEDALKLFVDRSTWKAPIVGVVADFHSASLHKAIEPLVFTSIGKTHRTFSIVLQPRGNDVDSWKKTLSRVETEWKAVYPGGDFSYSFLDEKIAAFYKSEQQIARLLKWATALAIFISCLGMLGLVIYTTNQRTKEIGVRKILGATVTQLVALLSKDFVKLVLLAFVITVPLAWWAMDKWLQSFAYRTNVSWWIFAVCGAAMLAIAMGIMAFKVIKAAISNPVKALRSE
ncbi:MAG: ABC transporter permease [Chitinophagaceae bacterium]